MANLGLLIGVACAILFFRAAQYERMSPWVWVLSSLGVTLIVNFLTSSLVFVIVAQIGLFGVMWWYNAKRPTPN